MTTETPLMVVTGSSKGIGRFLADYYLQLGWTVIGCSRSPSDLVHERYRHAALDVSDEKAVRDLFTMIQKDFGRVDALLNNAGIASMNHVLLTPFRTAESVMRTNVLGTFVFCCEAGKLMRKRKWGRIVNFATVAAPLRLEGEAIYAASKAAVVSLTQILAYELATMGITVNAVGPTPIKTDLIRGVPAAKMEALIHRQAIKRLGTFEDVANVIDFFLRPESNFISGQVLYLGGISG